MKRLLSTIMIVISLMMLVSCSSSKESEPETQNNPLINKLYARNRGNRDIIFSYFKFYEDNTVQAIESNGISASGDYKYTSYYGTYELKENALVINISNDSYSGAVIDNGNTIMLGNEEFIDNTDANYSDKFLSQFKK